MLRHDDGDLAEFVLLTLWESEEAVAAFAGKGSCAARLYPALDVYLCEHWPQARHYQFVHVDSHALPGFMVTHTN